MRLRLSCLIVLVAGVTSPPFERLVGAIPSSPSAFVVRAGSSSQRAIRVLVVASPSLHRSPSSRVQLGAVTGRAWAMLEPALERDMEVLAVRDWPDGMREVSVERHLDALRRSVRPEDADIVIGIAAVADYLPRTRSSPLDRGAASYEDGYVAVSLVGPLAGAERLLAHELAHLFGAVHRVDSGLMETDGTRPGLDPVNASLLGLHRERSFGRDRPVLDPARRDRALEIYDTLATGEGSAAARLLMARLQLEGGDPQRALMTLEPLLVGDRGVDVVMLAAIAHRRSGNPERALGLYASLDAAMAGDPRLHFNRGIALRAAGRWGEAESAYRRALELAPDHLPSLANLSELLAEAGRAAEAAASARAALEVDADDLLALGNLAYALAVAGELGEARQVVEGLLAAAPDSASAHNTLGRILDAEGDAGRALVAYERAAALDPGYVDGLVNLAQAHVRRGAAAAALPHAERALMLRPDFTAARVVLGRARLAAGDVRRAIEQLEIAASADPGSASAAGELGHAHLLAGDLEAAEHHTRVALELDPQLAWAWLNRGVIASRRGDPGAAVESYERALAVAPEDRRGWINLGHARLAMGDTDGAEEAYGRAAALGSDDGGIDHGLAQVYLHRGDIEAAWRHAVRALAASERLHPEFVEALERAKGQRLPGR